jgi:rubrerythrin
MVKKAGRFLCLASVLFILIATSPAGAQSPYRETIAALQIACRNEMHAHLNYSAYAQKAKSENYPNMAYLFASFAASELIHARNFKKILSDLGIEVKDPPRYEIKVSATKENLKKAIHFEIADIDERYPQLLEKVKPEKYEGAIRNLTYAWETEKQHRDLLQKMQSGTGIFFGLLARKIEETSVRYFVCQVCGSTIAELPKDICTICKIPVSNFEEVERIK